ncbi:MAG: class I SAM-dependent RNA methyltransferase [Candidatus Lernaella stagnicola]|nr:class I SAM-dependent RNA methyltransferase [Candidatus Lernaella stagnicola]
MIETKPEIGRRLEIVVESIAPSGKGKGRARDMSPKFSFFVEGTVPGDRVLAEVTGGKKRYFEADLIELREVGPDRVAPPCPHYEDCGGCQLQHLDYQAQLEAKRDVLRYHLKRLGFGDVDVPPLVASPNPLRYRVRSSLDLLPGGSLGMARRRSRDLVEIRSCHQMHAALESGLFQAAVKFAERYPRGRVKIVGVLDSTEPRRVFCHPYVDAREMHAPSDWFLLDSRSLRAAGDALCRYEAFGLDLRYAPDCFTQVNPSLNEKLVGYAVERLAPSRSTRVLELYAGIGNFTLPVARHAKRVTAVEWARGASFLTENARRNGLSNVTVIGGDAVTTLGSLARKKQQFEAVLLDPPREGLGPRGVDLLGALGPRRIVYVSCEPKSLLADVARLNGFRYRLASVQAFDMFPQTFHLETVAVLER